MIPSAGQNHRKLHLPTMLTRGAPIRMFGTDHRSLEAVSADTKYQSLIKGSI